MLLNACAASGLSTGDPLGFHCNLRFQKFDQNKAGIGVKSVFAQSKVLDCSRCSPASCVQPVWFLHAFGFEVMEVVLLQISNIVTEKYLELGIELVCQGLLHLAQRILCEDFGGWFPDNPRTMVVTGNHSH